MCSKEGLITEERVRLILSWRHTGFHIHNEDKVIANDTEGRGRLARYIIRPPVSLERLTYGNSHLFTALHRRLNIMVVLTESRT